MLVLSRKKDECIIIGKMRIVLKVIEIKGNQCRIGIKAPYQGVVRKEVVPEGQRPSPSTDDNETGWLVLSRFKDEEILIADDVDIMVVDIQGDKVRLGIKAPRDVTVHREEVYKAIKKKQDVPVDKASS